MPDCSLLHDYLLWPLPIWAMKQAVFRLLELQLLYSRVTKVSQSQTIDTLSRWHLAITPEDLSSSTVNFFSNAGLPWRTHWNAVSSHWAYKLEKLWAPSFATSGEVPSFPSCGYGCATHTPPHFPAAEAKKLFPLSPLHDLFINSQESFMIPCVLSLYLWNEDCFDTQLFLSETHTKKASKLPPSCPVPSV